MIRAASSLTKSTMENQALVDVAVLPITMNERIIQTSVKRSQVSNTRFLTIGSKRTAGMEKSENTQRGFKIVNE